MTIDHGLLTISSSFDQRGALLSDLFSEYWNEECGARSRTVPAWADPTRQTNVTHNPFAFPKWKVNCSALRARSLRPTTTSYRLSIPRPIFQSGIGAAASVRERSRRVGSIIVDPWSVMATRNVLAFVREKIPRLAPSARVCP